MPLPKRAQCALEDGGLNSRSSLGNWAAEPLLGLEVTLGTQGEESRCDCGAQQVARICAGLQFALRIPASSLPAMQ